MSGPSFTIKEKLAGVEHMIEALRPFRSQPETPQHRTLELLKAIARDLRAQLPGAPLRTMTSLEYRVETAQRQKARIGYIEIGVLQGIGEDVIGQWPELRRALERALVEAVDPGGCAPPVLASPPKIGDGQ